MTDFYRSEQTQAMVGYASDKILKTQGADDDELVYEQNGGTEVPFD